MHLSTKLVHLMHFSNHLKIEKKTIRNFLSVLICVLGVVIGVIAIYVVGHHGIVAILFCVCVSLSF